MKKRFALLAFALLQIGLLCVLCVVWVRKEQRQYALNRQLIAALKKADTKQALDLVEAGTDPNTRFEPLPAPSLSALIAQLLQRSVQENNSTTAFMIACGKGTPDTLILSGQDFQFFEANYFTISVKQPDAQLARAMLLHGARVNTKDENGWMPLHFAVMNESKDTIRLLLDYGADPNVSAIGIGTAIKRAEFITKIVPTSSLSCANTANTPEISLDTVTRIHTDTMPCSRLPSLSVPPMTISSHS